MKRYKRARYCPENIVISFAGGIDFQTAQALVESFFGSLEKGAYEERKPQVITTHLSLVKQKPIEQMHLAIGYPSLERDHPLTDALVTAKCFIELVKQKGKLFK